MSFLHLLNFCFFILRSTLDLLLMSTSQNVKEFAFKIEFLLLFHHFNTIFCPHFFFFSLPSPLVFYHVNFCQQTMRMREKITPSDGFHLLFYFIYFLTRKKNNTKRFPFSIWNSLSFRSLAHSFMLAFHLLLTVKGRKRKFKSTYLWIALPTFPSLHHFIRPTRNCNFISFLSYDGIFFLPFSFLFFFASL